MQTTLALLITFDGSWYLGYFEKETENNRKCLFTWFNMKITKNGMENKRVEENLSNIHIWFKLLVFLVYHAKLRDGAIQLTSKDVSLNWSVLTLSVVLQVLLQQLLFSMLRTLV